MEKWKCPKCGNEEYEKDQFQATGGNFAKIFDVQNKKFIPIIIVTIIIIAIVPYFNIFFIYLFSIFFILYLVH